MLIKGKTALVTGAAKRVGKQIALALARHGADILLHFNSSEAEAKKTASEITGLGVSCHLYQADLEDTSSITAFLDKLEKDHRKVDVLVNSASLFYKTPLPDAQENDLDAFVDIHLKAPFLLSKKLGLKMAKNGSGKIVNIADWSGMRPYKDYTPYCASKGGLITLTKGLARDLGPHVLVNAVAPGPVMLPEDFGQAEREAIAKTTAVGRLGSPEDVANAVVFLLENDFINGSVLVVDGGRSIV